MNKLVEKQPFLYTLVRSTSDVISSRRTLEDTVSSSRACGRDVRLGTSTVHSRDCVLLDEAGFVADMRDNSCFRQQRCF